MIVPLLHAVTTSADDALAIRAAIDLWPHDPPVARAVLLARSEHSLDAATFLYLQGEPGMHTPLWHALEHSDEDTHWQLAALALALQARTTPRFAAALVHIAGRDDAAIWMLHTISPTAALCGILEHLACTRTSTWQAQRHLTAMFRGQCPGDRPFAQLTGFLVHHDLSPENHGDRSLATDPTIELDLGWPSSLHSLATRLIQLAPTDTEQSAPNTIHLDLSPAMAFMLDGDASNWTQLWRCADAATATEIAEIRRIVDARPDDRPSQRLARLWWYLRLPLATLLEHEDRDTSPLVGEGPADLRLFTLLAQAYPDERSLRRSLTDLGLADQVLGAPIALADLRSDAARVLFAHGLAREAIHRAITAGLLPEAALAAFTSDAG